MDIEESSSEKRGPLLSELRTPKTEILILDMDEAMAKDAVELATSALTQFNLEKEVARYLKQKFDSKYTKTWHCVVGRSFGSVVTNEKDKFVYFKVDRYAIMLYKACT
ncbi:Dynein light chain 1, cytoplasmic [Cichlidogyrus casuarinus]|uniref:Dynein light chain n=1 Tax=Cichlidogyrus casuarinus TaxID=1844966 RepID=A0ABD2PZN9_9PLAT